MDWSTSVSRRLRLLGRVRPQRWPFWIGLLFWLLVADLALRALPYRRAAALLAGRLRQSPRGRPGSTLSEGQVLALAAQVDAAARYHLYPMQCLRRALVLRRLLMRRGVAAEIRFGVRKERGRLIAHAWVECGGRSLDQGAEKRYARLETSDALPLMRGPVPPREEGAPAEAPSAKLSP
jgi:hypothetical protein